jgi:hypothetical protein
MSKDITDKILELVDAIEETELDKANLAEILFNHVIKSRKVKTSDKVRAFDQKRYVNEIQNEAMGELIYASNRRHQLKRD